MVIFLDLPAEVRNRVYFDTESLVPTLFEPTYNEVHGGPEDADGGYEMISGRISCRYSITSKRLSGKRLIPSNTFPAQPIITKASREVRIEPLPIFYGANAFVILDGYEPWHDGVQTPFPKALLTWLHAVESYMRFFTRVEIYCLPRAAQRAHEVVAMLVDHGVAFEQGLLVEPRF